MNSNILSFINWRYLCSTLTFPFPAMIADFLYVIGNNYNVYRRNIYLLGQSVRSNNTITYQSKTLLYIL